MALDGIRAVGDDQEWKTRLEQIIADLRREVAILKKNQKV